MARKRAELTGQTIGYVFVIEAAGSREVNGTVQYLWKCKCIACGVEFIRDTSNLTKAKREARMISCGCKTSDVIKKAWEKRNSTPEDEIIPGRQFGLLTVIEEAQKINGSIAYLCKCNCGNSKVVRKASLLHPDRPTRSCGCVRAEVASARRIKLIEHGTRFERWTVIAGPEKRDGKILYYLCRCSCEKKTERWITADNLRRGMSKSCGCRNVERLYKHGLSRTPEYKRWEVRKRNNLRRQLGEKRSWTVEMELMLIQLQPVCVVCGSDQRLTIDHVQSLYEGGILVPGNAVRLCVHCNSKKHRKSVWSLAPDIRSKILSAAAAFLSAWEAHSKS